MAVAEEIIEGYKLLNCMMTGQNSQVWEVVEVSSGRHFAMKLLLPEKANQGDLRRLLFHEANVGQQLAHGNVIKHHARRHHQAASAFRDGVFPLRRP